MEHFTIKRERGRKGNRRQKRKSRIKKMEKNRREKKTERARITQKNPKEMKNKEEWQRVNKEIS